MSSALLSALLLLACESAPSPALDSPAQGCPTGLQDPAPALEAVIDGRADACQRALYLEILDDRAPGEGPWFEDLFVAPSADGATFALDQAVKIFTSAAVPEVHRGPDGRYYLFYGDGDLAHARRVAESGSDWFRTHGLSGFGALRLATSDDGLTFTVEEDFAVQGIVRGMVVDPDVIALPDGRYRMYYVGVPVPDLLGPDTWADGAPHDVWYAESDDLIRWRQIGRAAQGPNADPSVFCVGARCRMASTGIDWSQSEDGGVSFTFNRRGEPWGFAPEFLRLPDGRLRMFYNSKRPGGALESWISGDDGESWSSEGMRVGPRKVEAVSLAQAPDGVGWLVYYHYWREGISGDTWGQGVGVKKP